MADTNDDKTQTVDNVDVGVELSYVAALFDNVEDAKVAYKALREAQREGLVSVLDAAYVEKTDRSKIKVHDRDDRVVGQGVVGGGIAGAIIGIVGGTILLPAAIGVLIGGIVAEVYEHDVKFSSKEIKKFADSLPVGTSALVAVVEDVYVSDVEEEMSNQGGRKVHSGAVPKSTAEALGSSKSSRKTESN